MQIAELRVVGFRCFASGSWRFAPGVNYILGPNGAGKTSILEAAHAVSRFKSFRASNLRDLIAKGSQEFGVHAVCEKSELRLSWRAGKRAFWVDGVLSDHPTEAWGLLAVVPFTSHDLEIVRGGPAYKRLFLNTLMAQTDRDTISRQLRYQEIVRQRNAYLQADPSPDRQVFDILTEQMIAVGCELQKRRAQVAGAFEKMAARVHAVIAGKPETFSVTLRENHWNADLQAEREAGHSLIGFQRDYVDFAVEGRSASRFASEGQQRTAALALRAAEFLIVRSKIGVPPVVLADDVFGELDPARREALLSLVQEAGQVLITCTKKPVDATGDATTLTL